MVDLVGPRKLPSLRVKGVRGNHHVGGNLYMVLFVDRKTKRVFVSFVRAKDDLEAKVKEMRRHMEMQARHSVEATGAAPIRIQRFISDRDSNLTSDKAVALMLDRRIEHEMNAADARNQTPLLDNVARRMLDLIRVFRDMAGLGLEFWELAGRHAATIINRWPRRTT